MWSVCVGRECLSCVSSYGGVRRLGSCCGEMSGCCQRTINIRWEGEHV